MIHIHAARLRAALLFSMPLLGALIAGPAAAQLSITADITGTPPSGSVGANADIQNALNFLAADFYSATPFNMTATITWESLDPGVLGQSSTSSSDFRNVGGILYPNPLGRYLFGAPNTGGAPDFNLSLSTNFSWDYTLGTPANSGTYSLASVIDHEAMHAMGFTAGNNQNGSYIYNDPTLWTTHLFDATTAQLFTSDTTAQRAAALVSGDANGNSGDLLFVGPNEKAQNGGQGVEMYAPSTFQAGSSDGSHIASDQVNGDLMYYALPNGVYRTASPLVLSMMQDIGWQLAAAPEPSDLAGLGVGIIALAGLILKSRRRRAEA